ncbi:MAG: LPS assembly lipoprotein LptE, partial [Verrucomicrobiota bacterium]|nr:LPS assembly lipoprotein LptE [Verrucomicrobiota bacterium]
TVDFSASTLLLLFVVFIFTGCAGYQLGPTNGHAAREQSIQVNPFQNQTFEPRLGESLTLSLRKRLQQDGTYKLDTHGEGDIIVTGVIRRFDRSELSFQPSDVRTVRDYNLAMTAQIIATERSTGKIILDRPVSGRTTIRVGSDLTSAERQAIPLLAENLARNVVSLLADGTW